MKKHKKLRNNRKRKELIIWAKMNKYFCLLFIFILLSYGCAVKKDYKCPENLSKMDYDKLTNTYIDWVDCMPLRTCDEQDLGKYEKWVNKNCGIKYRLEIAY